MENIKEFVITFKGLQPEHIHGLITLGAFGVVAFALYVVYSVTKGPK